MEFILNDHSSLYKHCIKYLQVIAGSPVQRSRTNQSDVSKNLSQIKSSQQNLFVSKMPSSKWFANAFMKVYAHEEIIQNKYNLQLAVLKGNSRNIVPQAGQFRPPRAMASIPKIGIYVILATCRQKLHDIVVKEWLSTSVNDAIDKYNKPGNPPEEHTNHSTNVVKVIDSNSVFFGGGNFDLSNEGVDLGFGLFLRGQIKNNCLK